MKRYKIIRIYKVWANSRREALQLVHKAGDVADLIIEFAKEDEKQRGWLNALADQLFK